MPNSNFVIDTLDASDVPIFPKLELGGRAMPYQGFELEGSMRAEFTWYPGNAVATVQMLGAEEKPTTIKGMWKDKFIKTTDDEGRTVQPDGIAKVNEQQTPDVLQLTQAVEKMRLSGRLLKVTWAGIIRHGILIRFKQNWVRIEDLEWEMEFQWVSRGEPQTPPIIPIPRSTDSFVENMRNLLNTIITVIADVQNDFQVIEGWVASVNNAVILIEDAVVEMEDAVDNSINLISAPLETMQRALSAAQTIKDAASTIVETVEATPPLQLIKSNDPSALDLGDALRADQYERGVKDVARQMQLLASSEGDDLRAQLQKDELLASFIARSPMDLRDVSQKFYGTPDEWRSLMEYNAFDSSFLNIGDLVLVPKLNGADGRV